MLFRLIESSFRFIRSGLFQPRNQRITLYDSPVQFFRTTSVTFFPKQSVGNFSILTETDSNGSGDVKTIATGKKKDGAPKGDFRVTVERIVEKVADDADVKALEARMGEISPMEYLAEIQRLNEEKAQRNQELIDSVPESLRDVSTTPLSFSVSSPGELKIELSDYTQ